MQILVFKFCLTVAIVANSVLLFSQMNQQNTKQELCIELKNYIEQGIKFIEGNQIQITKYGEFYKGEWPTTMQMDKSFFYLGGKKKKAFDSNCFSITGTHNALAEIYLMYPEYENIPHVLHLAFEKILTYKKGDYFNFWNLLPPTRKLQRGDLIGEQPMTRRPTNFPLKRKYIHNAANITEDADDTSFGYLAMAMNRKIFGNSAVNGLLQSPKRLAPIFSKYRDLNRSNRHWFNHLRGNDHETGAFLTWFGEENHFKKWNILKATYHNGIWFHKSSQCYPHPYTPYIPYGTNDLDAVVNADILSSLAYNGELASPAIDAAVNYIEYKSSKNQDEIGIYYPNRFHFAYAVSEAYANGITELDSAMDNLIDFVIESQNSDGSFASRSRLNKKDPIQSTAYALNTLVNYGNFEDEKIILVIEHAMQYLFKNSINNKKEIHWEGGVFFSGGTVNRNTLVWKSDAYTTAIILKAFAKYKNQLEQLH